MLDRITRLIVQDKTHENECDVNILENHKKNVSRSEGSIWSTHTACQNHKNQKEIPLEIRFDQAGTNQCKPREDHGNSLIKEFELEE